MKVEYDAFRPVTIKYEEEIKFFSEEFKKRAIEILAEGDLTSERIKQLKYLRSKEWEYMTR